jgi:PAS domain S-box-containing protein
LSNKLALQKSEERFRLVVESAPNGIVMIGPTGLIEMVNAQTERMFGYTRNELLGKPIEMLVPERYRRNHPGLRKSFFAAPVSRPMGAGRDLYGLKKDGSEFAVEIGLNPIETDEGTMVLSAIVDISARKRLEERFRLVVESAPNGIVMIGPTGLIEMVNAQTERMFGYTRNELLGKPIEMLVPERYRRNHPGLRKSFFAAPVSRPMGAGRDLYGLKKDGSEFAVEIGLNPIETDEGIMVLSAIVDISARKQLEKRLHAINSMLTDMNRVSTVGELSASISHEIKQPLAAIVANANAGLRWLANERPNLDRARVTLKSIVSAGQRAGEVIDSLRSIYKKGSQEKIAVDIDEVVQDVLGLMRVELDKEGVNIQTELTRPLPLVGGHNGQLQQVILNLVRNAAQAMASVSRHARVLRVKTAIQDPDGVLVSIEDSGTGIDPENVERIFEPFFTTKSEGMGMGLAICRSLIEAHDGRLWASSGVDHGAVFNILLPAIGPELSNKHSQ